MAVTYEIKLMSDALCAHVGDYILDAKSLKVGKVVKMGQSGNEDLIYVDFGGKNPVRINTMMDAQCIGRYYKLIRKTYKEED